MNSIFKSRIFYFLWILHLGLFFGFCFRPGIFYSDDFAYLKSIIGTLQLDHPYRYEWLEPFGISFSYAISAIYLLSHQFYFSAFGFQAVCVILLYPLLTLLLMKKNQMNSAAMLSFILVSSPLFLGKEADFNACICTIDLFLIGLLFYSSKSWPGFFLFSFLAFLNRQNQIALLLLPATEVMSHYRYEKKINWKLSGSVLLWIFFAFYCLIKMNKTFAANQIQYFSNGFSPFLIRAFLTFTFGLCITLGTLGITHFIFSSKNSLTKYFHHKFLLKNISFPLFFTLILLGILPFLPSVKLMFDTPLFGMVSWQKLNMFLVGILFLSFWLFDFSTLKYSPFLILIFGYIGIASIRGVLWDYYFIEIVIINFITLPLNPIFSIESQRLKKWQLGIVCILFTFNLGYGYLMKLSQDKQKLSIQVFESLERSGRISVEAMSTAPFGYLGWKLFDYYIANEGKEIGTPVLFMAYVNPNCLRVETELPWRRGFKSSVPSAHILDSGVTSIGFLSLRYRVVDELGFDSQNLKSDSRFHLNTKNYQIQPFPLTKTEWNAYANVQANKRTLNFSP